MAVIKGARGNLKSVPLLLVLLMVLCLFATQLQTSIAGRPQPRHSPVPSKPGHGKGAPAHPAPFSQVKKGPVHPPSGPSPGDKPGIPPYPTLPTPPPPVESIIKPTSKGPVLPPSGPSPGNEPGMPPLPPAGVAVASPSPPTA